jgi:hypothetical protein
VRQAGAITRVTTLGREGWDAYSILRRVPER